MKPRRHRRRWYTAAGGTIAGVAGLAALTAATHVASSADQIPRPDPNPVSGHAGHGGKDATADDSSRARGSDERVGADRSDVRSDSKGNAQGRDEEGSGVPCDPAKLVQAILRANAQGGGTLDLAAHCTYSLLQHQGTNGLPIITQPITINGHYATIERNAAADPFRIFNVDVGGNLTLRDVTVRGGFQDLLLSPGGAGMLVRAGGQATVEHSRFLDNRSLSDGGAIANYGVTRILDGSGHEDSAGSSTSTTSTTSTELSENSARNDGGGIYNGGLLAAQGVRLRYNNAVGDDGGGLANVDGVALLERTSVDHNRAESVGAGVFSDGNGVTSLTNARVADNTSNVNGGGLYNGRSAVYVQHTDVSHNTAETFGGGFLNSLGQLVVDGSRVNANVAGIAGGGLYNGSGQAVLRNSEIDLNRAISTMGKGAGITNSSGSVRLTHARVAENLSTLAPGGILTGNDKVAVDNESSITRNVPTNCAPNTFNIPNCFD